MNEYKNILSDDVFVFEEYKNKTLTTMVNDDVDDGTVIYHMNEHGYRSNSFVDAKKFNILTLGCSWTMGLGVKNEQIWPELMAKKIDKECSLFNYSMYGVSVSFVAKTLYKITKTQLIPDMVLIMWPGFSRRDYIKSNGVFRKIGGFRMPNDKDLVWKNEEEDLLFIELRNDYQDLMIFWEAYKFVESIAKSHNIQVYHTIAGYYYEIFKELLPLLENIVDRRRFFIPNNCYKNDMKARDKHHPGPEWHFKFSKEFSTFIKSAL